MPAVETWKIPDTNHAFIPHQAMKTHFGKTFTDAVPLLSQQETLAVRMQLRKMMMHVLKECLVQKKHCLQDLDSIFDIKRIRVKSSNGEAYFAHLKTEEFRKCKCVLKLSEPLEDEELHDLIMLNQLVTKFHLPHFPLFYGQLHCPKTRCQYSSKANTLEFQAATVGCSVQCHEYLNGGHLEHWFQRVLPTLVKKNLDQARDILKHIVVLMMFSVYCLHTFTSLTHRDLHFLNIMLSYQDVTCAENPKRVPKKPIGYLHYLVREVQDRKFWTSVPPVTTSKELDQVYDDHPGALDVYVPYYGVQAYLIDFEFMSNENSPPSYPGDYYAILEGTLYYLRRLGLTSTLSPMVPRTTPAQDDPLCHLFMKKWLHPLHEKPLLSATYKDVEFTPTSVTWCHAFFVDFLRYWAPEYLQPPPDGAVVIRRDGQFPIVC